MCTWQKLLCYTGICSCVRKIKLSLPNPHDSASSSNFLFVILQILQLGIAILRQRISTGVL